MKLKNSFDKILKSKGFKKIELSHVIPSMKALKRSGDIRRNMFSYYDRNFQEMSLRPDLSWSAALKFAEEKSNLKSNHGVVYTGNPKILKKICPGVFGTIKPVGYCMIGQK